ncbi:hypothetical protein MATL_G00087920 [Megalops atlanticus]|uniref:NIDO domain-containing protein n=1 Tax=Megalops atlanticus TaxID=7932 RepID=A0A9D3TBA4_MEGAT|nr:hypothetical protein MATL_G00087920 [Megalops atlanticus]
MRLSAVLCVLQLLLTRASSVTFTCGDQVCPEGEDCADPPRCFDPCHDYTSLNDSWRATDFAVTYTPFDLVKCDTDIVWQGWYRLFLGNASVQMPERCIDRLMCGTHAPLWLNGAHPSLEDGVVSLPVCGNWYSGCCNFQSNPIHVKACPGNYFVYKFVAPVNCYLAYCADVNTAVCGTCGDYETCVSEDKITWRCEEQAILYPFGVDEGDVLNVGENDGSSPVISINNSFIFFGSKHQQIYVNNNGFLTFSRPLNGSVPLPFPSYSGDDIIAALWTDLDNSKNGTISYREVTSGYLLQQATHSINRYFPHFNFKASWLFIVTWDRVPYHPATGTEATFQVVLISDGTSSFILMNYGDIGPTNGSVQAGYKSKDSASYFTIPVPYTNLPFTSNVNVTGRWAFNTGCAPSAQHLVGLKVSIRAQTEHLDPSDPSLKQTLQNWIQENIGYSSGSANLQCSP